MFCTVLKIQLIERFKCHIITGIESDINIKYNFQM